MAWADGVKFRTIVADPPWPTDVVKLKMRPNQVALPFPVLSLETIASAGSSIRGMVGKDCGLFLWATHTSLLDATHIMSDWGFHYHCCLTWDKMGGRWCWGFQRTTEFVLFGHAGRININQRGSSFPTIFRERLTKHAVKPVVFYDLIEQHAPGPYLELFARQRRPGWFAYGNELEGGSDISIPEWGLK